MQTKSDLINWGLLASESKAAVGNCQITPDQNSIVNCITAIDLTDKYLNEHYDFQTQDKQKRLLMNGYFVSVAKATNMPVANVVELYTRTDSPRNSIDFLQNTLRLSPVQRIEFASLTPFVTAYHQWQFSKNVFVFDDTVWDSLYATAKDAEESSQNLPIEILKRLPVQCVAIPMMVIPVPEDDKLDAETLKREKEPGIIFASFCQTTEAEDEKEYALNISFVKRINGSPELLDPLMSTMVDISKGLKLKALNDWIEAYHRLEESVALADKDFERVESIKARVENQKLLVNLTLQACFYLCSDDPDLSQPIALETKPKKTKKGIRKFQAERVTQVDVGVRIGQAIRQNYVKHGYNENGQVNAGSGHKVRPHFRKAHWHTYKIGAMKREDGSKIPAHKRDSRVKWIPPVIVNAELGEVDVVVKPVVA